MNPSESTKERKNDLLKLLKSRRCTVFFWYGQGDAAAGVEAEAKVDDGSSARVLRQHKIEERRRGNGRKGKGPSVLFIRQRDKRQARKSRSPKNGCAAKLLPRLLEDH